MMPEVKLYVYQNRKCPLGHSDMCIGDKCAIFVDEAQCCAIRLIALANVPAPAKPIKKGGK